MPILDIDLERAKKQYEVNFWGVLAVTQAFFPMLRAAKGEALGSVFRYCSNTVARYRCQPGEYGWYSRLQPAIPEHILKL